MRPELGVFVNKYARESIKNSLERRLSQPHELIPDCSEVAEGIFPRKLIVVGGDGTAKRAIVKAHGLEEPSAVGILPGGTLNSFYTYLVEQGATVSIEEFSEIDSDTSRYCMFQPSIVGQNGNFIVAAGFGGWEANYAFFHDSRTIRRLPRDRQVKAAATASVLEMLKRSLTTRQPVLNSIFAIPKVGPMHITNGNEMDNDSFAHITMPGESQLQAIVKGAIVLIFCHYSGKPLSEMANTTYVETVCIPKEDIPTTGINVDGDLVKITGDAPLQISRSKKAIPVVALKT